MRLRLLVRKTFAPPFIYLEALVLLFHLSSPGRSFPVPSPGRSRALRPGHLLVRRCPPHSGELSCGYFEVLKLSRLLMLLWCRLTAISATGVLEITRLPDASPETITEETPSATVTPAPVVPWTAKILSHLGRWDRIFSHPTFFEVGGIENFPIGIPLPSRQVG
jgi:hypothetical protein